TSPPAGRTAALNQSPQRPAQFPAATAAAPAEQKSSWRDRFTFKNPFSKMFAERKTGGAEEQLTPPPEALAARQPQQRSPMAGGAPPTAHSMPPQYGAMAMATDSPNPRMQAPSRGPLSGRPGNDPFSATRPQGSANMPHATAQSTLGGPRG